MQALFGPDLALFGVEKSGHTVSSLSLDQCDNWSRFCAKKQTQDFCSRKKSKFINKAMRELWNYFRHFLGSKYSYVVKIGKIVKKIFKNSNFEF